MKIRVANKVALTVGRDPGKSYVAKSFLAPWLNWETFVSEEKFASTFEKGYF